MLQFGILKKKRVLLGVTGGIAAYKSAELLRLLIKAGADVKVVMTDSATEFVKPLTFQALSGEPVRTELFDEAAEAGMGHIELARWADLILIAPASANTIAKLAHGVADDLLTTLVVARKGKCVVCPAMNMHMWQNPAVSKNVASLEVLSIEVFGPAKGEQACGDVGYGRMLEPVEIIDALPSLFTQPYMAGKRVLITLGPTREYLDPVRYITNESSGLMGYEIASAAYEAGASVSVIAGPCQLQFPDAWQVFSVKTAEEMMAAVQANLINADIFIAAAAVSDYRFAEIFKQKMKKQADTLSLKLEKNPDILNFVGHQKSCPFVVGFAAETENVAENAQAKLKAKHADLIVANHVAKADIGFNSPDNAVTVFNHNGQVVSYIKQPKSSLAKKLMAHFSTQLEKKNETKHPA